MVTQSIPKWCFSPIFPLSSFYLIIISGGAASFPLPVGAYPAYSGYPMHVADQEVFSLFTKILLLLYIYSYHPYFLSECVACVVHWMNIESSFNKKLLIIIIILKWTFNHLILWWLWINEFLNNLRHFHIAIIFLNTRKLIFKHFTKI